MIRGAILVVTYLLPTSYAKEECAENDCGRAGEAAEETESMLVSMLQKKHEKEMELANKSLRPEVDSNGDDDDGDDDGGARVQIAPKEVQRALLATAVKSSAHPVDIAWDAL